LRLGPVEAGVWMLRSVLATNRREGALMSIRGRGERDRVGMTRIGVGADLARVDRSRILEIT
jgi:hypothetical protein